MVMITNNNKTHPPPPLARQKIIIIITIKKYRILLNVKSILVKIILTKQIKMFMTGYHLTNWTYYGSNLLSYFNICNFFGWGAGRVVLVVVTPQNL